VQRFAPLLAKAARPRRHAVGQRWFVDETDVKVAGQWRYVYRAVDQAGQVIDVFVAPRRDAKAARRFVGRAIGTTKMTPVAVVTDQAATYPTVLEALLPAAWRRTEQYANNRVECDRGRLKARLRPMRGSSGTATPPWFSPAMRSSRISGEATPSWPLRSRRTGGWR
jgi:IS6 family transposase